MPDEWSLVESAFEVRNNRHYEGLLAIGSGPVQQRASLEEGLRDSPQDIDYLRIMGNVTVEEFPASKSRVGTYLPGITGPHPTCRDEMINLPAIHGLVIFSGGERLDLERSRTSEYRRWLDLRHGRLHREFVWHTQAGPLLRLSFERFIAARRRHVMALRCRVQHLAGPPAELRWLGTLSAEVRTNGFDHFESVDITGEHEPITLTVHTNGGIEVATAAILTSDRPLAWSVETEPRWAAMVASSIVDPGGDLLVSKFAAITSARHVAGSPLDAARRMAWDAVSVGFDRLAAESDAVWEQRWQQTDVQIDGDPRSQLALRASLYHLLRAAPEPEHAPSAAIACGMDANAASGEAYCGRYFWDSDIFMLPALLYTRPAVGRALARFRIQSLAGARRNARRAGYPGARYAWESSPEGDENCPNWQYADHEVHVTADVAYGLWHAHLANPDDAKFLRQVTEVLVETARYWCARVHHDASGDQYELLMVMGPDEYSPFSRNNAYTNHLAALNLRLAGEAWRKLRQADAVAAGELSASLKLDEPELARFEHIAARMRRPFDPANNLVLQSDDFFALEPFDFDRWWPDRSRRLGACVLQERLYRSQVLKQADVVQLMAVCPQEFDVQQMRAAYETYAPLTSHDSSLSAPMHAMVAAWLGKDVEALELWSRSSGLDLEPPNAAEGIHAACAGANWQVVVLGFGGVRTGMQSEGLWIEPRLPRGWSGLRFPLVWGGQPLQIEVLRGQVSIEHRGTRPIAAFVLGKSAVLAPGERREFLGE